MMDVQNEDENEIDLGNGEDVDAQQRQEERLLNPPSIQAYLTERLETPHNEDIADALEWLRIYVLANNETGGEGEDGSLEDSFKGKTAGSEAEAKNLVNALSPQLRRDIFSILYDHVHPDHRCAATNGKKDLILWLQKQNATRDFLFYKVPGLKKLMEVRSITISGRCNKEDRIAALAGSLPSNRLAKQSKKKKKLDLPPKDLAIVKILEKSFLPHQKGDHREHCSLGHRLEKPILKKWITFIRSHPDSPAPGLCVKGAYTAGLAEKRDAPHAKDSIDFLLLVKEHPPPISSIE